MPMQTMLPSSLLIVVLIFSVLPVASVLAV
jgi:hypothetical protein